MARKRIRTTLNGVDKKVYHRIYAKGYVAGLRKAQKDNRTLDLRLQYLEEAIERASSFLQSL